MDPPLSEQSLSDSVGLRAALHYDIVLRCSTSTDALLVFWQHSKLSWCSGSQLCSPAGVMLA